MDYLFRFDGAKDNDEFFEKARHESEVMYYAGIEMRIGPWIPDGIRVRFSDGPGGPGEIQIVLIELEPTDVQARISARKYLPEPSNGVIQSLREYLERVEAQCRASGDPRLPEFRRLAAALGSVGYGQVSSAGHRRDCLSPVETLALIDNDRAFAVQSRPAAVPTKFVFGGDVILTPLQNKILARAVRVLDATVRGHDHSGAALKNWLAHRTQPLRCALSLSPDLFPALRALLESERQRGTRVSCDAIADDLAQLWSASGRAWNAEQVAFLVNNYWPIASLLKKFSAMPDVFTEARGVVSTAHNTQMEPTRAGSRTRAAHLER
jgi:hypothetical protein